MINGAEARPELNTKVGDGSEEFRSKKYHWFKAAPAQLVGYFGTAYKRLEVRTRVLKLLERYPQTDF